MDTRTKDEIYEQEISPKMKQLKEFCERNDIAFMCVFQPDSSNQAIITTGSADAGHGHCAIFFWIRDLIDWCENPAVAPLVASTINGLKKLVNTVLAERN